MKENGISLVLIAHLSLLAAGISLSQELLHYTVAVIQYHAQQHPGNFECVFYDISQGTDEGWFGILLSSPQLSNIAKYVIDDRFCISYTNFTHKPPLTVVYLGDRNMHPSLWPFPVRNVFFMLDSHSKVLVLGNTENHLASIGFEVLLNDLQYDKVTFLGTKTKRVVQMGSNGRPLRTMRVFPEPKDLIVSSVRKLRRPIGVSSNTDPMYSTLVWVVLTARFLNTGIQQYPSVCTGDLSGNECSHKMSNALHIDIMLDRIASDSLMPKAHRMIFDCRPIAQVILVPQGRPISAIQMFTKPFTLETWVVLIITLILIEVVSLMFPMLYKNDPIMLLVCGFERYNLHHASAKEKATILPLIIFFFLMFNAYETKLISFMMDKPSIGNAKTIQDVAKLNLPVVAEIDADSRISNDTLLGHLAVQDNRTDSLSLDEDNVYLTDTHLAPVITSLVRNYDFKLRRPKYVIVNERRLTSVVGYWVGLKSPFAETFYYTQKVFFEAGLINKWFGEKYSWVRSTDRVNFRSVDDDATGMLTFDDLTSTWAVFSIGLSVSGLVFLLELGLNYLKGFKTKKINK